MKQKKTNNAHDSFFKSIMNVSQNGERFLRDHLPKGISSLIKPSGLSIVDGTFIDEQFREMRSDILYQAKLEDGFCYIYILMEHKSYADPNTPLQLLGYMLRIWERFRKDHKKGTCPRFCPSFSIMDAPNGRMSPFLLRLMPNY